MTKGKITKGIDPKDYEYSYNREVIYPEPDIDQADHRRYPNYTIDYDGVEIEMAMCCDLEGGRWEYYHIFASAEDAIAYRDLKGLGR